MAEEINFRVCRDDFEKLAVTRAQYWCATAYLTMVKLSPPSILVVLNRKIAQATVHEIVDGL